MGQSQVCSFCSNHEKEQDLFENKKDNFLILENKEKSLMETPILKQSNNNYPLSLNYIGGYSNYSFEGFNILGSKVIRNRVLYNKEHNKFPNLP